MRLSILAKPSRTAARLRPRRRRASHLAAAALVALAWAGPTTTPAQAQNSYLYSSCVAGVTDFVHDCWDLNTTVNGDIGCFVMGVAGLFACALMEAVVIVGGGVSLP